MWGTRAWSREQTRGGLHISSCPERPCTLTRVTEAARSRSSQGGEGEAAVPALRRPDWPVPSRPHGVGAVWPSVDGLPARSPVSRSGEHTAGTHGPSDSKATLPRRRDRGLGWPGLSYRCHPRVPVPALLGSASSGSSLELAPGPEVTPTPFRIPSTTSRQTSPTDPSRGAAAPCNRVVCTGSWSPRPWPVDTCSRCP